MHFFAVNSWCTVVCWCSRHFSHYDLTITLTGHIGVFLPQFGYGKCLLLQELQLVAMFGGDIPTLGRKYLETSRCTRKLKIEYFRLEGEAYIHYKSMLISLALHLILLMFELLVCDKLESGRHLWILVFIPLIFISIVSIAVCIWAVKHDRSFEVSEHEQLTVDFLTIDSTNND